MTQQPRERIGKNVGLGQQADDHEGFVRQVEEETGMNQNPLPLEEIENDLLLASGCRNSHQQRPAALHRQQVAGGILRKEAFCGCHIGEYALLDGCSHRGAVTQQSRRGCLNRCADRQKRIRNQLQCMSGSSSDTRCE